MLINGRTALNYYFKQFVRNITTKLGKVGLSFASRKFYRFLVHVDVHCTRVKTIISFIALTESLLGIFSVL